MIVIHGKGGHGRTIARFSGEHWFTDDTEGTRPNPGDRFIIGIGDNATRKTLGPGNYTVIADGAKGDAAGISRNGVYIGALAYIGPGAVVHDGAIVNTGAIVEHDCVVGPYSHIAPRATLCGGVTVGEGALVGAGAVVKPGIHIGEWAVIGCGAVVVNDVPAHETWAGNPARFRGKDRAGRGSLCLALARFFRGLQWLK